MRATACLHVFNSLQMLPWVNLDTISDSNQQAAAYHGSSLMDR